MSRWVGLSRPSTLSIGVLGLLMASAVLHAAAAVEVPLLYQQVARELAVPVTVLYAIAHVESGAALSSGQTKPWPWTLSIDRVAYYYRTQAEAARAAELALLRRVSQLGVGLMQIEWGYHGDKAGTFFEALTPETNVRLGARILGEERAAAEGDLWRAVGRYHSRDEARARTYRARVRRWLDRLEREPVSERVEGAYQ